MSPQGPSPALTPSPAHLATLAANNLGQEGFFVVFEGADGAGKTTQVNLLARYLRGVGREVVTTREPGGTALGQTVRNLLLHGGQVSARAEALLYAADRAQHVDSVIRPALERGAVVISDRYIDSSLAYQGAGRVLAAEDIANISAWATQGLAPHVTVLLDVDAAISVDRQAQRRREADRIEKENADFHERVRTGFRALAAADPERYLVVDAGQKVTDIAAQVRARAITDMRKLSTATSRNDEDEHILSEQRKGGQQ